MGFLVRLFFIFIIAYSIYSIIMFVLRLFFRRAQRNVPPFRNDERLGGGFRRRGDRDGGKVIELGRDQYKVE